MDQSKIMTMIAISMLIINLYIEYVMIIAVR